MTYPCSVPQGPGELITVRLRVSSKGWNQVSRCSVSESNIIMWPLAMPTQIESLVGSTQVIHATASSWSLYDSDSAERLLRTTAQSTLKWFCLFSESHLLSTDLHTDKTLFSSRETFRKEICVCGLFSSPSGPPYHTASMSKASISPGFVNYM